jgi:pantothenate kinase, type III
MHILMTIDVGNTNIALGLMAEKKVLGSFRLTTQTPRTSDEFGICIRSLMDSSGVKAEDVDDVIISSVVPKRMYALTASIRKYIQKEPLLVGPGMKTGIQLRNDNPREVGADRIVDVTAAHYLFERNCIVVDFGTATTFDYVTKQGVFEYTVIAPGLGISSNALTSQTAKLPEIEIQKPKSILGKNTVAGMQAGVVYGYIGLVEGIIRQMKKELKDPDCYVVATGGLGKVIATETKEINEYDPDIAYKGMRILYDLNKKK